jgi:[protein-PII] uridylyltransferase
MVGRPPENSHVQYQLDLNPQRRLTFLAEVSGRVLAMRETLMTTNRRNGGLEACRHYSHQIDQLLADVYQWLVGEARVSSEDAGRLAICAQGGYGRCEMNPFSDIDLLFLLPDQPKPVEQALIKSMLYLLWDLKNVETGHATKTMAEALEAIGTDLDSTTSMCSLRWVAGNRNAPGELHRRVLSALRGQSRRWFIDAVMAAAAERRDKFGRSVYLLEPDVKDGDGGLRDIHTMQWLSTALLGGQDLETLQHRGILSVAELNSVQEAHNFLLRVRTALHQSEGRKADGLTFDKQPKVAAALGYLSDGTLLAEEKLMRTYYLHARSIDRYCQKTGRMLRTRAQSLFGGVFEKIRRRALNDDYYIKGGVLHAANPNDLERFRRDPSEILSVFLLSAMTGATMSEELKDILIQARALANSEEFRSSPRSRDLFMRILGQKQGSARTLRAMRDTGILQDYLPEFAKVTCMVRIDHYHRYTVDEHLIKTLEFSETLLEGDRAASPELIEAARTIRRWDLLNLSLLLHDIGKGEGHGHVIRGAIISQQLTQRMGLAPADQEVVRQLILLHLKMVHISQRRDLEDRSTIEEMAAACPDPEIFKMLFVLTYCDTRAVGPNVWTDWKSQLLSNLYRKTQLFLQGLDHNETFDQDQLSRYIRSILVEHPGGVTLDEVERFINSAPQKYLQAMPAAKMAQHIMLMRELRTEGRHIAWAMNQPEEFNYTEISVVSKDGKGGLSATCAALSSKDINILSVQAFSTKDGHAIDVFQVTDLRGDRLPQGFRLDRLFQDLNDLHAHCKDPAEVFPVRRRSSTLVPAERPDLSTVKPSQLLFNNEVSPNYTVLEVKAHDRPGLLYDVTSTCASQGYFIHLAMITTEAYRVVDVFYLTDVEYNKLEGPQIRRLEAALKEVVGAA